MTGKHHGDFRASVQRFFHHSRAHLAAAEIGNHTRIVQLFVGGTAGHKHAFSGKLLILTKYPFAGYDNLFRLGKSSLPHVAARKKTAFGVHKIHAAFFQRGNVCAIRCAVVHVNVHGRANNHWGGCRHKRCRQHVVCNTVCVLPDNVCRGRRNHKQIGFFGKGNMFNITMNVRGKHIYGHGIV